MWFSKKKENEHDRWKPENIYERMKESNYVYEDKVGTEIEFTADRNNLILFRSLERESEAKALTFKTVEEFEERFNEGERLAVWSVNVTESSAMYYQGYLTMLGVDNMKRYIKFSITLFPGDEGVQGKVNVDKDILVDMLTGFPVMSKTDEETNRLKSTYNEEEIKEIIRNLI